MPTERGAPGDGLTRSRSLQEKREGQYNQQSRAHVTEIGDPGNGFHMQRM